MPERQSEILSPETGGRLMSRCRAPAGASAESRDDGPHSECAGRDRSRRWPRSASWGGPAPHISTFTRIQPRRHPLRARWRQTATTGGAAFRRRAPARAIITRSNTSPPWRFEPVRLGGISPGYRARLPKGPCPLHPSHSMSRPHRPPQPPRRSLRMTGAEGGPGNIEILTTECPDD